MSASTIRRAIPTDLVAIDRLMSRTSRLAIHLPWSDVRQALGTEYSFLVEVEGQLGCVWCLSIEPETIARIQIFALDDHWSVCGVLATIIPQVRRGLREQGVTRIAFVGMEQWLIDGLVANGFRLVNTIVTLQKTDLSVPDRGNQQVAVRPSTRADLESIMAVEKAVFEPLWHSDIGTLAEYLQRYPYFVVTALGKEIVGYQYASLTGRHGHLARIAVHPRYHGQRIGVRLLTEAMCFFRRKRVLGVTLNTQRDNRQARDLYEWFGFKVLGKEAQVLVLDI